LGMHVKRIVYLQSSWTDRKCRTLLLSWYVGYELVLLTVERHRRGKLLFKFMDGNSIDALEMQDILTAVIDQQNGTRRSVIGECDMSADALTTATN